MNFLTPQTRSARRLLDRLAPLPEPDEQGRYTVVEAMRIDLREQFGATLCAIEHEAVETYRLREAAAIPRRGWAEAGRISREAREQPSPEVPPTPDEELVEPPTEPFRFRMSCASCNGAYFMGGEFENHRCGGR